MTYEINGQPQLDASNIISGVFAGARIPHFPIDRLAGVLATQASWDVAPTNLANATDGDPATSTDIGTINNVASYTAGAGYILFDMIAIYTVDIKGLLLAGGAGAYQSCGPIIAASLDNVTYHYVNPGIVNNIAWVFANNGTVSVSVSGYARCRYIKLTMGNIGIMQNLFLGITEIKALDFGF
jgi:hypothetical protein